MIVISNKEIVLICQNIDTPGKKVGQIITSNWVVFKGMM